MVKCYSSSQETYFRPTDRHPPYRITDTGERARLNSSQIGWYSIYLPLMDGRLS